MVRSVAQILQDRGEKPAGYMIRESHVKFGGGLVSRPYIEHTEIKYIPERGHDKGREITAYYIRLNNRGQRIAEAFYKQFPKPSHTVTNRWAKHTILLSTFVGKGYDYQDVQSIWHEAIVSGVSRCHVDVDEILYTCGEDKNPKWACIYATVEQAALGIISNTVGKEYDSPILNQEAFIVDFNPDSEGMNVIQEKETRYTSDELISMLKDIEEAIPLAELTHMEHCVLCAFNGICGFEKMGSTEIKAKYQINWYTFGKVMRSAVDKLRRVLGVDSTLDILTANRKNKP